jgi:ABC-type Co2+ transport system permease subunit
MKHGTIAAALAAALFVAGCMGAQAPVTTLGDNTQSYCIEEQAAFDGYRLSCRVVTCKASDQSKSKAINTEARKLCLAPKDSDKAKVKSFVAQQRAVGRVK